jgi:hypothetical protein
MWEWERGGMKIIVEDYDETVSEIFCMFALSILCML